MSSASNRAGGHCARATPEDAGASARGSDDRFGTWNEASPPEAVGEAARAGVQRARRALGPLSGNGIAGPERDPAEASPRHSSEEESVARPSLSLVP